MTVTTQNPPIWGTSNCNGCKTCTLSFGLHSTQSLGGSAFISSFWKGASPASTESNLTFASLKWRATKWSEDGQFFAGLYSWRPPLKRWKACLVRESEHQTPCSWSHYHAYPISALLAILEQTVRGSCFVFYTSLLSVCDCRSLNDPTHSPIFWFRWLRCEFSLFPFWSTVHS